MENKKPKLTDPEEFAIIKSIYFKDNRNTEENIDPIERLERMNSRERNSKKSSR